MITVGNKILPVIKEHKSGKSIGITSICSANKYVIKAAILNAKMKSSNVVLESTSNQVDQFGGYTGMTPNNFRDFVRTLAASENFPVSNIILGGDHLGPNVWQNKSSAVAMENAKDQITAYIRAGYSKIHLDASMKCADDGNTELPMQTNIIAERVARLCKTAETVFAEYGNKNEPPVYIIGTDVPPPGGSKAKNGDIHITNPDEVEETVAVTNNAFIKNNLEIAWKRVIAVVVQPGVEFGDENVFDYNRQKAAGLVNKINGMGNLIYEAHSTDYQSAKSLREMVEDHFAILKVGPWLTFAFREAVFALEMIEKELFAHRKSITLSGITSNLIRIMKQNPDSWKKYYENAENPDVVFKLKYSFSDRIRYYWNYSSITEALKNLIQNLSNGKITLTLLSQFLPSEYEKVRNKEIKNSPEDLIINKILDVLSIYNYATAG